MHVLFVGHRGVGKSDVGARVAAALDRPFVDIDAAIEAATGRTCAELVADDEPGFRIRELTTLAEALRGDDAVISAGAGLQTVPHEPIVVWLHRDGWEEVAERERQRLRPELEWSSELEWMCTTREPRWLDAAHMRVDVPRGRGPDRAARDVATLVGWLEGPKSEVARKTWVVVDQPAALERAARDARRFGLAGVEVRSDVVAPFRVADAPVLASVRTDDPEWIAAAVTGAVAFDVDVENLDTFARCGVFDLRPRPLVLSTHPPSIDPDDVTGLVSAARRVQLEYPAWAAELSVKYAPQVSSLADVGLGRALLAPLRRTGIGVTYLPQGASFAWLRPILASENATNYVAARLRASRAGLHGKGYTAWDLQDWVPHLTGPTPSTWDGLIGDPVEQSQGDLWHRRAALEAGEATGYVKIHVASDDLGSALALLAELPIRGLSVTSPLKSQIKFICPDDASYGELLSEDAVWSAAKIDAPVRTGNTLLRRGDRWLATDTDEQGMAASLAWFEDREIGPATIALFGSGGVRHALLAAIEASDWFLVYRCRARDGWPDDKPPFVTLVVNAAGPGSSAHEHPPKSRAWLDLHYRDVDEPPDGVVHLAGDVFFDAQAAAQRAFWRQP